MAASDSASHRVSVVTAATAAAALLDPTRAALVSRLAAPDSASGLARQLGLPRQRVNYHLRELERLGLVELVEERRKGNCLERVVRATARAYLVAPPAVGAEAVDAADPAQRHSSSALIGAAASLVRDVADARARADAAGKRIATLAIQTDVRFASAAARAAFAEEIAAAVMEIASKYHDGHAPGGRRFRLLVGCYPVVSPRQPGPSQESANDDHADVPSRDRRD